MLFKKNEVMDFGDFNLNPGESIDLTEHYEKLMFTMDNDQLQTAINSIMNYIINGKDDELLCKCQDALSELLYIQVKRSRVLCTSAQGSE